MCHDARRTADQVQALQNISLAVELRKRILERQKYVNYESRGVMASGIDAGLELALILLDELCPPPQSN